MVTFFHEDKQKTDLIIVHGGGGFSHSVASVYGLKKGLAEEDAVGLPLTILSGRKLNERFVEALLDYGLPVLPLQPSSLAVSSNGIVTNVFLDPILLGLKYKWIPILYGDLILDEIKRVKVLSGEDIIYHLCKMTNPSRVIIFTDVKGIYSNIKDKNSLISEIKPENIQDALSASGASKNTDVTGGMAHKLKILYEITALGIECLITSGLESGNILKSLRGEKIEGTRIAAKSAE